MTESLELAVTSLLGAVKELDDPFERYEVAKELGSRLEREIKELKAEAVRTLHDGKSWREVGELLGVSGARAEQISRAAR